MITIKSNNNFHTATATSVFDVQASVRFKEYRRKWKECPEKFIVNDFPIHLDIENTSNCNLSCPFCARTHNNWGTGENGFMGFELYKKIIDEGARNGLCSIKLSLRGEPLLHPSIIEMIRYAKENGVIDIYFNTNGLLLSREICQKLIDVGLPRISISIEGIDAETYERLRPGANFKLLLKNVNNLRQARMENNSLFPQIRIQTVLTDEMKKKFELYVEYWKPYADEVSYLDYREEGHGVDHRGLKANWACPFLWQRMTILWDGTLLPCLAHGIENHSGIILGKIPAVSIKEMWQGERVNNMRALHRSGRAHEISECDRCSYHALEVKKILN